MFDSYADIFADRALGYQRAMEALPSARAAEFRAALEPLDDMRGGILCDMPSGGCYLARFLKPGLRYVGIDPVDDFASAGSSQFAEVLKAGLTAVPLESASVDFVVSIAGLHHEPDLRPIFREMWRIVRQGGHVVIADVAQGTPPAGFLNGFVARSNPAGHDGRFLDELTAPLLEEARLRVLEDQIVEAPWQFASVEEAGEFAAQLFGTDGASPREVAEALAAEIGFTKREAQVRLNWSLRRIVCVAD